VRSGEVQEGPRIRNAEPLKILLPRRSMRLHGGCDGMDASHPSEDAGDLIDKSVHNTYPSLRRRPRAGHVESALLASEAAALTAAWRVVS
jgi:hypothetical protein